ncbi:hypothetical protein BGW41_003811 [Actinomortierella wolfii]|nr:hypothetical protein BGW41_003811 [Actinomortierella wolfii]
MQSANVELNAAGRQKRLKAGTACTNCRRKKLRCTGTPHCARCVTHNLECRVDEALFLKTNSPQHLLAKKAEYAAAAAAMAASQGNDERRMSTSSANSDLTGSSLSPSPSPAYTYSSSNTLSSSYPGRQGQYSDPFQSSLLDSSYSSSSTMGHQHSSHTSATAAPQSYTQQTKPRKQSVSTSSSSSKKGYRSDSGLDPIITSSSHSSNHPSQTGDQQPSSPKKRMSKDHGSTKPKQKRRNSRVEPGSLSARSGGENDPGSPPPLSESPTPSDRKNSFKSVVSTMSLDGHGQHFHGSSSGFYVCQLSSRYRQGVYPLPMAHLNDSDLWSHSLQMTSERELPPQEEMNMLLNLYFRYMYPFAPMFVRKRFMEDHHKKRPDLSQILILNAIFCNACWYSDDPAVKQDSTKYFNRAKIILDETYHVSRISTVQALLLMSHHQYAVGNYSGGWLYTGMAIRIAHDIGLHRQDIETLEPIEAETRKRVWWAVYIADRLGGGVLGRPLILRDKEYNVDPPSDQWITESGIDDTVEYPYEPERIISCRLQWAVKLFTQMGNVLNTMHCIEAETNGAFLADISRTQLPQLHNSLTSWFLSLPNELMYTPYTMSPNSNHPPSPPTALMHMFYYTTLTMLHRPYLRPVNSAAIDPNFLVSSRNICTAAATNVCHIADSLMLHGQLRDTCYYGMACLLAAGTVHVHNAITPTPSNRETTRAGLSKTVKAAHELVKTFPVAESLIAVALDVFASQTSSVPTEMAASFIDISTFVAPFIDMSQLQSTSIGNIYEAARLAKQAKDGPGPAPSIQLRHPYGDFSMPLPDGKDQSPSSLSSLWQNQIATAVAMAAIAFGGTDPQQEQQFFANPLDLPEALRLAPIDQLMFQVDPTTPTTSAVAAPTTVVPSAVTATTDASAGLSTFGHHSVAPTSTTSDLIDPNSMHLNHAAAFGGTQNYTSAPAQTPIVSSQAASSAGFVATAPVSAAPQPPKMDASALLSAAMMGVAAAVTSGQNPLSIFSQMHQQQQQQHSSFHPSQPQQQQQQEHQQQQQQQAPQQHTLNNIHHTMMEDDTADPPSPPAISSDDMDMESACLSDEISSPSNSSSSSSSENSIFTSTAKSASSTSTSSNLRVDVQTQCEEGEELDESKMLDVASRPKLSIAASVPSNPPLAGTNPTTTVEQSLHLQQQQQQQQGCHKDVESVNSLLFDNQAMEC